VNNIPFAKAETENQATTNSYASLLKAKIVDLPNCSIVIKNRGDTNVADWKVLVSNDPEGASGTFAEEKAEAQLATEALAKYEIAQPVVWVDVQVKANAGGSQTNMDCWLYAQRG